MAHFARLDDGDNVIYVMVVNNDVILDTSGRESEAVGIEFCKTIWGRNSIWVQTSYNSNFRKNYAGHGYRYDRARDAFIPPQPYQSWMLDEATCQWEAPTPYPQDGKAYIWNDKVGYWEPLV